VPADTTTMTTAEGVAPCNWGGEREGAGRKRARRPRVLHRVRPPFDARFPVLVTLRVLAWLPSLRQPLMLEAWRKRIEPRETFQVLDWTLQVDHLHFIAEACDGDAFERGIIGLASSFARRFNRIIGRVEGGRVFDHRHHRRAITTTSSLDRAIYYVHRNWKKHGLVSRETCAHDPFSSEAEHADVIARARTHLARRYASDLEVLSQAALHL
jgi:hypothetical protein